MRVQLTIVQQFTQGLGADGQPSAFVPGVDAATGAPKAVPEEAWLEWQADTLANRLEGGYVKWQPAPDVDAIIGPDPMTLDKDQLWQYIVDTFDTKLDKRIGLPSMQQQLHVLQERKRLQDSAAAAEAAKAAAAAADKPDADKPDADKPDTKQD